MTTGEQGRTPPDAEHYLDLSGIEEDSPGPHFDVVLRGYDRRQVDEHVAGLRRMNAQLRAQLAVRERRRSAAPETSVSSGLEGRVSDTIPEARRADHHETGDAAPGSPDMVGAFNDRLRGILQAAEQEAQLVRSKAAESLLAEHAESRAALAELRAQRDAVVDELVRLRGRLDDIVSGPTRPSAAPPAPPRPGPAGPWRGPARPPGPPHPGHRPPGPYGGPPAFAPGSVDQPTMHPVAHPVDADATAADTVSVDAAAESDGAQESGTPETSESQVDVTEGTQPAASASRPAPSSPERAADG
ncbi:hypothetical protein [Actinomycetospora chibensis]|uniref:Antigen 84 n=1 Tax=Actinomycetospora chibensis TaxID=663606 RepID=A0ABV9RE29_9PSEU|nr:hypothetical protein [Actinomycetospora chibensis]MDD7924017.1 hypothetical protein [Actinomycetospora chibensis]